MKLFVGAYLHIYGDDNISDSSARVLAYLSATCLHAAQDDLAHHM